MSAALRGITALVTRPAVQAVRLCAMIEQHGGTAVKFPALAIEPIPLSAATRKLLADVDRFDIVIFISRNAVIHAVPFLRHIQPGTPLTAAVGPGTAAELRKAGCQVDLGPGRTADSEGLLAEPGLETVAGKRVLIIRGRGGREHLASVLQQRGAEVRYAEVYCRQRPRHPAKLIDEVAAALRESRIRFTIVNSVATLENLLSYFSGSARSALFATELVTASGRVVKEAVNSGFTRSPVLAASPLDEALVAAIVERLQGAGE